MGANSILAFGQGPGTPNVISQATYSADAQRPIGNQPGVARADFVNKSLLQAIAMAVGLGQFIADFQASDVTDQLTGAQLSAMMKLAVREAGSVGYKGTTTITGATVLTATDVGKLTVLGGSTGYSATLPALSALNTGEALFFHNSASGTGVINVVAAGADQIDVGDVLVTSMAVGVGESLVLMKNTFGTWSAVDGTATLRVAPFHKAVLTNPGYFKLPNGAIVQFGSVVTSASASVAVSFPLTFPNACLALVPGVGANAPQAATYDTLTTTGFNMSGWTTNTGARAAITSAWWIAVGF